MVVKLLENTPIGELVIIKEMCLNYILLINYSNNIQSAMFHLTTIKIARNQKDS